MSETRETEDDTILCSRNEEEEKREKKNTQRRKKESKQCVCLSPYFLFVLFPRVGER